MKSYLELVRHSARIHRKKNRMSIFCIALSVFLVTVIFGMADMFIRSQLLQTEKEAGSWHVMVRDIGEDMARQIGARPDVKAVAWYDILNYRGGEGYTMDGKKVMVAGCDESWGANMLVDFIREGRFPETEQEAIAPESARDWLGIKAGDSVTVDTPGGASVSYVISGFFQNVPKTMSEDSYALFLNREGFARFKERAGAGDASSVEDASGPEAIREGAATGGGVYYVQFRSALGIRGSIRGMKADLGLSDGQVTENMKLLGLLGQSGNALMLRIYGTAAALVVLVLTAGVFMIAGSLNTSVAQRTEFFGMLRCIGASPGQVMRLVRLEALSWCRVAVFLGVGAGLGLVWMLCAVLRRLSPIYFEGMPVFGISLPSILAGAGCGLLTVLLASRAPARRAARVSPLAAVSGNANPAGPARKAAVPSMLRVDVSLGIHHAWENRKNFILMAGSFALSIILFLTFSVAVEFMERSLTPLRPWSPDLYVMSPDNTCTVSRGLLDQLKEDPAVRRAYGRMFAFGISAEVNGTEAKTDLMSYEETQFGWAKEYLVDGSVDAAEAETGVAQGGTGMAQGEAGMAQGEAGDDTPGSSALPQVLAVAFRQNQIRVGDRIVLETGTTRTQVQVGGLISSSPYNTDPNTLKVICSEALFRSLTGREDYTIIDIKLSRKATGADVERIHRMAGGAYTFGDERLGNQSAMGVFYALSLFVYGFLAVIAVITVFHIINSISMSVSARMAQYGMLRAIGLSVRQMRRMVVAEACTCAAAGCLAGCALGVPLNRLMYRWLVTYQWKAPWSVPWAQLALILGIVAMAVVLAVRGPVRRLGEMSIVEEISG